MRRRYSLAPILALTGWSLNRVTEISPCNGEEYRRRRDEGVTELIAERLAVAAGLHAYNVWPEMIAEAYRTCDECGGLFVPARAGHRFCTPKCNRRRRQREWRAQRYHTDPEFAASQRAAAREHYAANRRGASITSRLYRQTHAVQIAARQRAWYEANRERVLERQRDYDARRRAMSDRNKIAAPTRVDGSTTLSPSMQGCQTQPCRVIVMDEEIAA